MRFGESCRRVKKDAKQYLSFKKPLSLYLSSNLRVLVLIWHQIGLSNLRLAVQDSLASTLVDDAPRLLHGWEGAGPPLGELLHGEAPTMSRLSLRCRPARVDDFSDDLSELPNSEAVPPFGNNSDGPLQHEDSQSPPVPRVFYALF